jgi:hypothetical protein
MGVPEDQVAAFLADDPETPDVFEVYPCNWQAVQVFLAMETQWRVAPMGGAVGLVYEALPVVFDLLDVRRKHRPALFKKLREIEAGALTRED